MDGLAELKPRLPQAAFWHGKRVFVTGHTGFKGGWLSLWLHRLGAVTAGYALAPVTEPNMFSVSGIAGHLHHQLGDIRNLDQLRQAVQDFAPEIFIHMAAQPLVRKSYHEPLETFETNLMGTVNVLNVINATAGLRLGLMITTDKVYAESPHRHIETDRLGGVDPYSASKACAELAVASYPLMPDKRIAALRSGNVIGGGDWSEDRLVADIMKNLLRGKTTMLRNPHSIRPWQHVLDPISGYLLAAEYLYEHGSAARDVWNFGPDESSEVAVREVAKNISQLWGAPDDFEVMEAGEAPHEALVLRLDSAKAKHELDWAPRWNLNMALEKTVDWYKAFVAGEDMVAFTSAQINQYQDI